MFQVRQALASYFNAYNHWCRICMHLRYTPVSFASTVQFGICSLPLGRKSICLDIQPGEQMCAVISCLPGTCPENVSAGWQLVVKDSGELESTVLYASKTKRECRLNLAICHECWVQCRSAGWHHPALPSMGTSLAHSYYSTSGNNQQAGRKNITQYRVSECDFQVILELPILYCMLALIVAVEYRIWSRYV